MLCSIRKIKLAVKCVVQFVSGACEQISSGNLSIRESLVVSAYSRPPARLYRLWGKGKEVQRQTNGGWRIPFFLGGKTRGAFGQTAFFLAGNRMSTIDFEKEVFLKSLACLAKRFSSTEVKFKTRQKYQTSINGKKKFKRILSCPFGGRRKFQVTKFAFEDFIFVVGSAGNSVGTTLEFEAFRSGPDAKYSELVPSCFLFCPQPWFLWRSEHIFSQKSTRLFSRPSCDQ